MVPELRRQFNSRFSPETYRAFVADLDHSLDRTLRFRINESPLFLSREFSALLCEAADDVVSQLRRAHARGLLEGAVPPALTVPGAEGHAWFLQLDFAITRSAAGDCRPQLIELQGFPSLYGFQYFLNRKIRQHFPLPDGLSPYYNGVDGAGYLERLKRIIVADADPETVVLLERLPHEQVTRADFLCMQQLVGIPTVCVSDLRVRRGRFHYRQGGREIPIHRIYNRIIFDLANRDECRVCFRDDVEVTWVGHPNWFFRFSKYALPHLEGPYTPGCHVVADLEQLPADLGEYVLKPLFAFSGAGVVVGPTAEQVSSLEDPRHWLLQRRVNYTPALETPLGASKVEIRMMYLWEDEPLLVNNLVRTSRGALMGVSRNREEEWVGATLAYHPV